MTQKPMAGMDQDKMQQAFDKMQQAQEEMMGAAGFTTEQRPEWMQQIQGEGMRLNLARSGFDDAALIQAIQDFQAERVQARRPLRVTATLIYLTNGQHRDRFSDAQFESLLTRYESEVEAQRADERAAEDDLDAKIQWKTRPRLKAWLLQEGVIGDASWLARSSLAAGTDTELEIVQFWNENGTLPPELALPDAPPSAK